jgi:signal transduction histidine kinase
VRVFPDDQLQPKGNRHYMPDPATWTPKSIQISQIDLTQDFGRVEQPAAPLIRVATPLHTPGGTLFGLLIASIDLRPTFARIRHQGDASFLRYVVNEQGDYLVHPDPSREFGFLLGRPHRIQDEYPGFRLPAGDTAVSQVLADSTGREFGVATIASKPGGTGERVAVVEMQPYEDMVAAIRPLRDAVLWTSLFATVAAVALASVLARSLSRPLRQISDAADAFAQGRPVTLPENAGGEVGALASSFRRMADQVNERNAALRHNAELLDKTIASIADAVLVIDRDGKIVFTNPACRTLFGNRDDVGSADWQKSYERFLPDGVTPMPAEDAPIGRAQRAESFDELQVIMRRAGEAKDNHIVASGRPVRDTDGKFEGGVIVYRDVTEARETERQLRQAQKLETVGQLTGGVAHDFNNILTVIVGTISVLEDRDGVDADMRKALQAIDRAAMRGAELTRNLLAVARQQTLRPRQTDINALAKDASTLLRATLGSDIEIQLALGADVAPVVIDSSQVTAALLNLAVNARDAMHDGGKLTIETGNAVLDDAYAQANPGAIAGCYVLLAVSDTGTGMTPDVLERVFEPFFTTKEEGKGTGLGLSMIYGFIKQSHGHIKIYSEPGHGTTIKMYLPKSACEEDEATVDAAPMSAPRHATILVVEDDAEVRATALQHLKSLGYRTIAAASGPEAMEMIRSGIAFDLLFTDVIMPGGMNGRELADQLRALRPGIPVLFTSGYTENALLLHGRLPPDVVLLNKPYRKAELARKLHDLLFKNA